MYGMKRIVWPDVAIESPPPERFMGKLWTSDEEGQCGVWAEESDWEEEKERTEAEQAQYVALDCEMVGVGPTGCRSALARCCIVDWGGKIIYDEYVMPNETVTDFRTFVSGIEEGDLEGGLSLRECRKEVAAILKSKVLVGHDLSHDFQALKMGHPAHMTRDTARYRPYQQTRGRARGKAGGKLWPKSLKNLAQEFLGRTIQTGQHHPAEDACAAMDLYKAAREEWEDSL